MYFENVTFSSFFLSSTFFFSISFFTKNPKSMLKIMKMTCAKTTFLTMYYFYHLKIPGTKNPIHPIANLPPYFKLTKQMDTIIDHKYMLFSTTALMVSWSIMEFSMYYMEKDHKLMKFLHTLCLFLLLMFHITSASKMHYLFIGWEGVGVLSFILMSWWFTRKEAKNAAMQAIVYNRTADMGLILLAASLFHYGLWQLSWLPTMEKENTKKMILMASMIAAMGKSAQFSLHPWLPAAMEGPTPVSALLHSSTMVVAGVFLLIRMTNVMKTPKMLYMCSMMGSLTAMFAATAAFRQHDMKKMIAYSTTSQLGLMFIAMGMKLPKMALFHMCTHAFFKAMLFLCSGSIIHSYKKEQDLRKLSKMSSTLPMTSACLLLGSLSLMGMPFLSGFFSKDMILENIINSPAKMMMFILASTATMLTAAYSFRIMTFCFLTNPSNSSISYTKEENKKLTKPLIRLAMGTMMMGWTMSKWLMEIPISFKKETFKKMPLLCSMLGTIMSSTIILKMKKKMKVTFFTKKWFYQKILHKNMMKLMSKASLIYVSKTMDRGWKETMGGQGMSSMKKKMSAKNQLIQSSYMKQYLLSITLILSMFLLLLILL